MKTHKTFFTIASCLFVIIAVFIGCKKDLLTHGLLPVQISEARDWYQTAYPVNAKSVKSTLSINDAPDYSQQVQPNWDKAVQYRRFGQDVTEVPIIDNSKFAISLKNATNGLTSYKNASSKSSFLILKDSAGYNAFVMTILADSSYLKGNINKLNALKYNHRDEDFSGMVAYFTPKGQLINIWRYINGKIIINNNDLSTNQFKI